MPDKNGNLTQEEKELIEREEHIPDLDIVKTWAYGRAKSLEIDQSTVIQKWCIASGTSATAADHPKYAIVLHCTGTNKTADSVVQRTWNKDKNSAQFVLERVSSDNQNLRPRGGANRKLLQRIVPELKEAGHARPLNTHTIGIEIMNVANVWVDPNSGKYLADKEYEPSYISGTPSDKNAYIEISDEVRKTKMHGPGMSGKFQALQDRQYENLILLLRHLCTQHEIPRQFLGKTTQEMFCTVADPAKTIGKFKGVWHHRNVTDNKPCPGVLHRNRIYRGITEEWWLPCEMDGGIRTYYSGPFKMPEYVEGCQQPGFFRWRGTTFIKDDTCVDPKDESDGLMNPGYFTPVVDSTTYSGADIHAIAEYKSYYDRNNNAAHYGYCEKPGGTYPIGANRSWHGGVHFFPKLENATVYAAASGTIVAARIHSHEDTDTHPDFGSQRFVLLQHAVHELGDDGKVNYKSDPKIVFSLYMHLDKFADATKEDPKNPPWFNIWVRDCGGSVPDVDALQDDRGIVFAPNVEVSVGDILGIAGRFGKDQPCLHFEIFTPEETLKIDNPKTKPNKEFYEDPSDKDGYCDSAYLDSVLTAKMNQGLNDADPIVAAFFLREAKTYHISEWAFSKSALEKIYELEIKKHPNDKTLLEKSRDEDWAHINRFLWWKDACSASQELAKVLGKDGFAYYYHPVTFIQCINENVALEYTEIPKLTAGKSKEPTEVDGKPVQLRLTFSGISQQSSGMPEVVAGEMLHYSGYVNGEHIGTVSANGSCLGVTLSIGSKWNCETTVFENKSLTILVHCYAESEKNKQTGALDTAKCVLTKDSSTPWGTSQNSVVTESVNGLFSVFFSVREFKES